MTDMNMLMNMTPQEGAFGDDGWRDTGEGGLYVYAVFNPEWKTHSTVISTVLEFTELDTMVGAVGPLAEQYKVAERAMGPYWEYKNVPVETAILIGSTGSSYYWDEYMIYGRDNLTVAGLVTITALESMYGEATFLTFLDT